MPSVMMLRFALATAVLLLAACASEDEIFARNDMVLESDTCRASSISDVDRQSSRDSHAPFDKLTAFGREYRACMTAKGYTLGANAR